MVSLVLLALLALAIYALTRRSSGDRPPAPAAPGEDRLAAWVAAGLVSGEQADAIRAHEAALVPPPPVGPGARRPRLPGVAEPLGYLGAVLGIVGLLLVVSRFWADMGPAARLALSGAGAVAAVAGGSLVPESREPALARLRWSLWLLATAAAGLFGGIAAVDGVGLDAAESVVLAVASTVAVLSAVLWRGAERPVQQLTALAGAITAVGAAAAHADPQLGAGAAAAVTGGVVLAAGLRHATTAPPLSTLIGAVGVAVGSQLLATERPALQLVAVAMGVALVGLASLPRLQPQVEHRIAGAVGAVLLLATVPASIGFFAQDAGVATGLVVWAVGATVLVLGVRGLVERAPVVEVVGGLALLVGAAVTGVQAGALAPLLGITTGIGLLALGAASEELRHSVLGALGLLVNVPWAIGRFFPGEGRVPVLILAAGVLVLGFAVLLARRGGGGIGRPGPA